MDRLLLSRIDEELDSAEVAELCFLCSDVINRKRLEGIKDAKELFLRLEEKGLLENSSYLSELLHTIHRADLLSMLESDNRHSEETDAKPMLSDYRLMLYKIHEDLTKENLDKMKYLLTDQMAKRHLEMSSTALNVFAEMEKAGLLSHRNVDKLHEILLEFDRQLAMTVEHYRATRGFLPTAPPLEQVQHPRGTMDQQRPTDNRPIFRPSLSMCETQPAPSSAEVVYSDNQPPAESPFSDDNEYYSMTRHPRGLCVIFNNETFSVNKLGRRSGTQADEEALSSLFKLFGFEVKTHKDLTAVAMEKELKKLNERDYSNEDALVVCILTHGEKGAVFGTDGKNVKLDKVIDGFKNTQVPSLIGKPKLFFIQACQNEDSKEEDLRNQKMALEGVLESDSSSQNTVAAHADILVGMATVPNQKSYRNTITGSLYIQELCRQLEIAARSPQNDDILTVLTRVNREVSKNLSAPERQMPEPKYTFTKRLVFRFV